MISLLAFVSDTLSAQTFINERTADVSLQVCPLSKYCPVSSAHCNYSYRSEQSYPLWRQHDSLSDQVLASGLYRLSFSLACRSPLLPLVCFLCLRHLWIYNVRRDKVPVIIVPSTVNVVCNLYQIGSTVLYMCVLTLGTVPLFWARVWLSLYYPVLS